MVKTNPFITSELLPAIIAYWTHVIEAPEVNKITVFNNGTSHGLNTSIPTGGHTEPIWITGDKLEWKYAQKNATKNKTSETINNTKPILTLERINGVCLPKKVDSRITSLNHEIITNNNIKNPEITKYLEEAYKCIALTIPVVNTKEAIDSANGHGL